MIHHSIIETRGCAPFPEFTGERVYMEPFRKRDGLPARLSRWQATVDAMLAGIDTDQPIYLMIDQAHAAAGTTHRRPGLHVDGYWNPAMLAHGAGGAIGRHGHQPTPRHEPLSRNEHVGHGAQPPPRHGPTPVSLPTRNDHTGHGANAASWNTASFDAPEGIILASSVSAARGFVGRYNGAIGEMGDCAKVDVSTLDALSMLAGRVYAGNVNCLHESLPVERDCLRTVVRLNVPGWTPRPLAS